MLFNFLQITNNKKTDVHGDELRSEEGRDKGNAERVSGFFNFSYFAKTIFKFHKTINAQN